MNRSISNLNHQLRRAANYLSPRNPIRQALSKVWNRVLENSVEYVEIPIGENWIRLLPQFRHLSPDYESQTLKVWTKLLKPGAVVWDIGGNIGLYTILSGKSVGPSGQVESWEPTPDSFESIARHIAANGLAETCCVHQAAVSEVDGGTLPFSVVGGVGTNPMNRLGSNVGSVIEVPVVSIDGILERTKRRPDFLKIDIEGAEVFALRGARELMSSQRPVILLAVHPMFLPEFGCEPAELAQMVANRNYIAFDIHGREASPIEYDEYVLVPRERKAEISDRLGWSANGSP